MSVQELINDQSSCKLIFFKIIHTKVLKASVSMPLLGGNELPEDELSFIKFGYQLSGYELSSDQLT